MAVMVRFAVLLGPFAVLAACSSSSSPSGSTPPLGQSENGRATYYAATGSGACGFDPSPNDLDVAAMDAPEWGGSAVCGECVQVTGPKGEVTVRIVDQCPECEPGHLDLSQEAFGKIADVSAGNVTITWQVVACNVQGPVQYHIKDGSSQWWTAIQVRNSKLPIAKLEYKTGAGAYTNVARVDYNYFVVDQGVGPDPYMVRITSQNGEVLEDSLPAVVANANVPGGAQFP
jgi:expansin (peptidoglycan-binding protein)